MSASAVAVGEGGRGTRPPRVSGGLPGLGHLLELRRSPIELFFRAWRECGEVAELRFARHPVVMLFGEDAQEAFFRAPDEQLDQAAAYPFMTPVFGRGVVFDATPEQRKQALRNRSLRDQAMRGHAETIAAETERMLGRLGATGELDLLDFFAELTIYTSSSCLIGPEFRSELGPELVGVFKDLERGTDAFAYVNPYLPLPSFRRRDQARAELVRMLEGIFERRERAERPAQDLFAVLRRLRLDDGRPRFSLDEITGMFISMMFAGHHTTSGTAAWALIELLRHPDELRRVTGELDELFADGESVSHHALGAMPALENAIKEGLRLHPPLVLLMRRVVGGFEYGGFQVPEGASVAVSPAVSNRMPEHFPEPERFWPDRYAPGREEDRRLFAWIPFGAGRHRCVGAAFAMIQLKAILGSLLRACEFELAQPPGSYANDHTKMVVQLKQPCRVRYRRREAARPAASAGSARGGEAGAAPAPGRLVVEADLDLCQGHAACVGEAPELFALDRESMRVRCLAPHVPAELEEKARAAARRCPTGALRVRAREP